MPATRSTEGLQRHPISQAWGDMSDVEFDALVADIDKHGQLTPIVLIDGDMVLDGWHVLQACAALNRDVKFRDFPEGRDPYTWAVSTNAMRRNNLDRRASITKIRELASRDQAQIDADNEAAREKANELREAASG